MSRRVWVAVPLLLGASLALAGCTYDDDGSSGGRNGGNGSGSGADPIEISGTAQGLLDCTLNGLAEVALTPSSETLPPEAAGRSYTITDAPGSDDPTGQGAFAFCILFSDGTEAGTSGTVPEGASGFTVYVDLGADLAYTMTIE